MELWQAYAILRRRWPLIVGLVIISVAIAAGVVLLQKREYRATTTINTGVGRTADWYGTNIQIADMREVLLSRYLLTQLNDRVGLNKPLKDIEKQITVTRVGESSVLRVDVVWDDPNKARDAANTLAGLFVDYQTGQLRVQAERDSKLLENQLNLARERVQRAQDNVPQGPQDDPNVRAAQEELIAARQNLAQVINKLDEAKAQAANYSASNNAQIVDRAIAPPEAEPNNLLRTLLFGALFGLLLGILLAIGLEYLNSTNRLLGELEGSLAVPILGVIPWERRFKVAKRQLGEWGGRREAFRLLRTNLLLPWRRAAQERPGPLTALVVAAQPRTGGTSVAVGLGVSMAQTGQRVLLVDANPDGTGLHNHARVAGAPGLSDWLSDPDYPVGGLAQPTVVPNLHILPSGGLLSEMRDLFTARDMEQFFSALGREFDAILVDGPDLAHSSDVRILAEAIGGVILVVRPRGNDVSGRVQRAVRMFGDQLLGVVLNGVELAGGFVPDTPALRPLTALPASDEPVIVAPFRSGGRR